MATTATLVFAGHNRLRYFIQGDTPGESVTIPCTGGATPDLLTDSLAGPIKNIAKIKTDGYGKIAAGTSLSSAQAEALLNSADAVAQLGPHVSSAILRIIRLVPQVGDEPSAYADAGSPDAQAPRIIATMGDTDDDFYLDIEVPGAIGA